MKSVIRHAFEYTITYDKQYDALYKLTWTWPWWMSSNSAGAFSLDNDRVVSFFRLRLCMVRNRPLGNRLPWWATDSSSTTSPSDNNRERLLHRSSVGESSVDRINKNNITGENDTKSKIDGNDVNNIYCEARERRKNYT